MANQCSSAEVFPALPSGWFAAKFCAWFIAFECAYFFIPDDFLRDVVYHRFLVNPCVAIIQWLSPHEAVTGQQNFLLAPHANLEIVRGCDGAGAMFLLAAAMLAFRASPLHKSRGLVFGVALLAALNYGRIVGLYFLSAYASHHFLLVHSYLAPSFIIVLSCFVFAIWARRSPRPRRAAK
ncbi:MAG TPA: exosortase family protein XrtM [Cellvibrionaceae bacterium]|nr:exosortase family protein XrtM [Cellvibrionaceae bacterium]HMY39356.1 exosortase family protein XrtM [Marinagarivorans sp.]